MTQISLTFLCLLILSVKSFILLPISRLVNQPVRVRASGKGSGDNDRTSATAELYATRGNNIRRPSNEPRKISRKSTKNTVPDFIFRNKKIMELGRMGLWKEILNLVEKEKHQFNNVNWSTTFSQLGRIRGLNRRDQLFLSFLNHYSCCLCDQGLEWAGLRAVANAVHTIGKMQLRYPATTRIIEFVSQGENARKIVQEGNTQQVANICWALGKLRFKVAPSFLAEVEKRAAWLVREGKPQEVSNTAWAFATLGVKSPILFAEIEKEAHWLVKEGNTQNVANTAWAFATLGVPSPTLFSEIEKQAGWFVREGTPQNVANTVWSFATLGVRSPGLFTEIERKSEWLVREGNTQAVANLAWAFATLDVHSPKLFAEIEKHADWLIQEGNTQAVSNTAWAFATLGVRAPELFEQIEMRSDWLVNNGCTQEVAITAWAFATLAVSSPKLFADIENRAEWLVKNGNTQQIANTVWAASILQYDSPMLLKEADLHGMEIIAQGRTQHISNLALAFANSNYKAITFFTEMANHVSKLTMYGNKQDIINACYGIVILNLGREHPDALCQLWNAAINLEPETLTRQDLTQLAQVFAYSRADEVELVQPSSTISLKIRNTAASSTQSRYQNEVLQSLEQLGLYCEEEVAPLKGGEVNNNDMLCIDLACESQMLAIEYDGEFHFLRELTTGKITRKENGATEAKRRFLQQIGWTVMNIDYRDWMEAQSNSMELQYLREKLNQVGVQVTKDMKGEVAKNVKRAVAGENAKQETVSSAFELIQLGKLRKKDHLLDIDAELIVRGISLDHPDDHPNPKKAGQPKLWTEKKEDIQRNEERMRGSEPGYDKRFFKKQSTAAFCITLDGT